MLLAILLDIVVGVLEEFLDLEVSELGRAGGGLVGGGVGREEGLLCIL